MGDRVLIKRVVNEAKTTGGIIFSWNGEDKTSEGIVMEVGPGHKTDEDIIIPTGVEVGDRVLYNVTAGVPVKVDGEDMTMLKAEDIYAVVGEE